MSAVETLSLPLVTAEELARLSDAGHNLELVRGELREMAPASWEHGARTASLAAHATVCVDLNDLGLCFTAETGVVLARNPDTVLAPDWAFVSRARVSPNWSAGFIPVVPDLVLETRSPSASASEVAGKIREWLNAGVRIVWDLDPQHRRLTVHRADTPPEVLGVDDVLSGEDLLPGFRLPLRLVFRDAARR